MGPMKPGSAPVALRTRSALAIRNGLATPGSFCAFTAFNSWSPRTTKATTSPSPPSTSSVLTRRAGRDGGRHLQIGGVIIGIGEDDGVLSGVREDVEFLGCGAADAAAVRPHGAKLKAHARKNAGVRLGHEAIALGKAGFVHVKGVRILHQELAGAHDAEARPDFIAELGLYLIEIDRQLLVTA